MKQLLTHSRRQCLMTCARKHQFEYELGIRPEIQSKPLRFGRVFHEALDRLAQGMPLVNVLELVRHEYITPPEWVNTEDAALEWFTECETCAVMVEGYHWRWSQDQVDVLTTEQSFRIPLRNPDGKDPKRSESKLFDLAGKIDKIVKWRGMLAVMEHKTTSEPIEGDAEYWKRLTIDPQISIYVIAARELGHDVSTVLYDVIRKPTIDRKLVNDVDENGKNIVIDAAGNRVFKKDGSPRESSDTKKGYELKRHRETPEEFGQRLLQDIYDRPHYYFQRREIPRLDADITEAKKELWHTQKILRECQRGNYWPRNTHACLKPFRCPYTDICFNGINPEHSLPDGFVRLQDVHPEL